MNIKQNRVISVLLVVCMCVALLATAAFAAETETADVAKIDLKVSAIGASSDMTVTVTAAVAMTEKQAEAAAALGVEALAGKQFVCTLSDDAGFIAANADKIDLKKVEINADSIYEAVSAEVRDGTIVLVYQLRKDAVAKDAPIADVKAALLADKTTLTVTVGKIAVEKDVAAVVSAEVKGEKSVIAAGETEVFLSAAMPFVDVPSDAYYTQPVLWAVKKNITNGTSETTYSPHDTCTRAQIVTFLWRAAGEPKAEKAVNPFTDVKEGVYYYDAVLWAVEQKITNGTSETTFSPDVGCNRAMAVTFLWRANGEPKAEKAVNPFTDVAEGQYYTDAVLWANETNVTNGVSETSFAPLMLCERAHIITFVYRDWCNQPNIEA